MRTLGMTAAVVGLLLAMSHVVAPRAVALEIDSALLEEAFAVSGTGLESDVSTTGATISAGLYLNHTYNLWGNSSACTKQATATTSNSYYFEYGTSTAYGSVTETVTVADDFDGSASAILTGLNANTQYHYRIVYTGKLRSGVYAVSCPGLDASFTTSADSAQSESSTTSDSTTTSTTTSSTTTYTSSGSSSSDGKAPKVRLSVTGRTFDEKNKPLYALHSGAQQ